MCRCLTCPNSCATTTSISPREKRPSSSVSQSTTCVDGPRPIANAFAWSVTSLTFCTRTGGFTPSVRAITLDVVADGLVLQRLGADRGEPARHEDEQEREPDEHPGAGDPPEAAEAHREGDEQRDRGERGHRVPGERARCIASHAPTSNDPSPQWCCHQRLAMPNGSCTAQSVVSTTMPRITAVPTRPSPIPRAERGSTCVSTTSATTVAIVLSSQSTCRPFS